MAGGHDKFGPGVSNLPLLDSSIENTFFLERRCPGAAACPATITALAIRIHFDEILTALLENPAWFLEIPPTESLERFSSVIAGIVIGGELLVNRFIDLDTPLAYIVIQDVENRYNLEFFQVLLVPVFQPEPGGIVGVASLG